MRCHWRVRLCHEYLSMSTALVSVWLPSASLRARSHVFNRRPRDLVLRNYKQHPYKSSTKSDTSCTISFFARIAIRCLYNLWILTVPYAPLPPLATSPPLGPPPLYVPARALPSATVRPSPPRPATLRFLSSLLSLPLPNSQTQWPT